MKFKSVLIVVFILAASISGKHVIAQSAQPAPSTEKEEISANDKLVVLWTSGDREVALKMVFMYTYNAKTRGWWEDITLVVWGPSAKILSEDEELQEYMKRIMEAGVTVKACKGCSDQYGISEKLEELGITVLYIGKEMTDYMKEGREILTI
jgi:hypothetical protein